MKGTTYLAIIALLICVVMAVETASNLSEEATNLAQRIQELEAQIQSAGSKHVAQTRMLAQSEGLLDELKMLFLNLALKIVEAVS